MIKSNVFQVERPWGNFRQFTKNELSTVKIITVNPNSKLSLQSHNKRSEFWKVISGSGVFEINKEKIDVEEGSEEVVPTGALHRMVGGEKGMTVLEISFGEFDEEDIVRYEDDYGRV